MQGGDGPSLSLRPEAWLPQIPSLTLGSLQWPTQPTNGLISWRPSRIISQLYALNGDCSWKAEDRTGQLSSGCEKAFGPWGLHLYNKQRRRACLGREGEWVRSVASALWLAGGSQGSPEFRA